MPRPRSAGPLTAPPPSLPAPLPHPHRSSCAQCEYVENNKKTEALINHLNGIQDGLILVFVETKKAADHLGAFVLSLCRAARRGRRRRACLQLLASPSVWCTPLVLPLTRVPTSPSPRPSPQLVCRLTAAPVSCTPLHTRPPPLQSTTCPAWATHPRPSTATAASASARRRSRSSSPARAPSSWPRMWRCVHAAAPRERAGWTHRSNGAANRVVHEPS